MNLSIRKARKDMGLTQEQIAKMVGVSLTSYQLWERGVTTPKDENLYKLNEILAMNGK